MSDLWRPGRLRPMLAEAAREPFDDPDYVFEIKWDGYRFLAFLDRDAFPGAGLFLQSRNGNDLTGRFPELRELGDRRWRRTIVDGEIVALRRNRPDFHALQRRMGFPEAAGAPDGARILLIAFDLLLEQGRDLTRYPLRERRERLVERLDGVAGVEVPDAFPERGRDLFELAVRRGFEGIVGKRADSPYLPGRRSRSWLKIRRWREADCVIGGVAPGAGEGGFGSLLVGAYREPKARERGRGLVYLGHVGTGFDAGEIRRVLGRLQPRPRPPFERIPARQPRVLWVEPEIVCRVEYHELTPEGRLRHPVYRGIREDLPPGACLIPPS